MDWTPEELQAIVDEHPLVLFMKGEPGAAQCGFSNRAAQVLQSLGEPFASVNILTDPRAIPSVCAWSDFPTMPQVFVHGELICLLYTSPSPRDGLLSRMPSSA